MEPELETLYRVAADHIKVPTWVLKSASRHIEIQLDAWGLENSK